MSIFSPFSFSRISEQRLLAAIDSIEREINTHHHKSSAHLTGATEALAQAKKLSKKSTSSAWNYIQEAELHVLRAMAEPAWRAKAKQ